MTNMKHDLITYLEHKKHIILDFYRIQRPVPVTLTCRSKRYNSQREGSRSVIQQHFPTSVLKNLQRLFFCPEHQDSPSVVLQKNKQNITLFKIIELLPHWMVEFKLKNKYMVVCIPPVTLQRNIDRCFFIFYLEYMEIQKYGLRHIQCHHMCYFQNTKCHTDFV